MFPRRNPNGQRDQPTIAFGFGIEGGEGVWVVGGVVVGGVGVGGVGGLPLLFAAPLRRVMLPTRSVRVIDCPAGE